MSSAWGNSWGTSWGNSWGSVEGGGPAPPPANQPPFWAGGLNKVFRYTLAVGTATIDFAPFWTDPEGDPIVDYQIDFTLSADMALPAGWSFDNATGVLTVDKSVAGTHAGWRMTAEDDQGNIGMSAEFTINVVEITVVTFRFEMS